MASKLYFWLSFLSLLISFEPVSINHLGLSESVWWIPMPLQPRNWLWHTSCLDAGYIVFIQGFALSKWLRRWRGPFFKWSPPLCISHLCIRKQNIYSSNNSLMTKISYLFLGIAFALRTKKSSRCQFCSFSTVAYLRHAKDHTKWQFN